MLTQKSFNTYCTNQNWLNKKWLIAVSGGVDSMCLLYLAHKIGIDAIVVHCNFGLRGLESDADELLVKETCTKYNYAFISNKFDTLTYANATKVSTQMAARDLRYEWFQTFINDKKVDYIAIAQHLNDSIETVLLNLAKGTGLAGLHGILPERNNIIRPLSSFSKQTILDFANENRIVWREDQSNSSSKYQRNLIRNEIVPLFKKINPSLEESFSISIKRIQAAEKIWNNYVEQTIKKFIIKFESHWEIYLPDFIKIDSYNLILFEFLRTFNVSFVLNEEIVDLFNKQSGKKIEFQGWIFLKDREKLLIYSENELSKIDNFTINETGNNLINCNLNLSLTCQNTETESLSKNEICIDKDKITFPLLLRKIQNGDSFKPLGMKSQKKINDYLSDKKISNFEKSNTFLLISNEKIIWVIGHQINDDVKITSSTTNYLTIQLKKNK